MLVVTNGAADPKDSFHFAGSLLFSSDPEADPNPLRGFTSKKKLQSYLVKLKVGNISI